MVLWRSSVSFVKKDFKDSGSPSNCCRPLVGGNPLGMKCLLLQAVASSRNVSHEGSWGRIKRQRIHPSNSRLANTPHPGKNAYMNNDISFKQQENAVSLPAQNDPVSMTFPESWESAPEEDRAIFTLAVHGGLDPTSISRICHASRSHVLSVLSRLSPLTGDASEAHGKLRHSMWESTALRALLHITNEKLLSGTPAELAAVASLAERHVGKNHEPDLEREVPEESGLSARERLKQYARSLGEGNRDQDTEASEEEDV